MNRYSSRRQRRERIEADDRYTRRFRQFLTSCDGCSGQLRQTHDYVLYGNLCWVCWRQDQRVVSKL
jgi:hypothetical protein